MAFLVYRNLKQFIIKLKDVYLATFGKNESFMKIFVYLFICILGMLFKSEFVCCQTKSFDNPSYILAKEELRNYIIEIYKEDKKEFYEDASGKEKTEIKSLLLDRKERTLALLDKDLLIITGPIYEYVNTVFKKIVKFNPQIGFKKVIIVKTESVNAFTAGEGIIYLNLGLLYRIQSEEQLAYILCHEFSHDKLNHLRLLIIKKVRRLTIWSVWAELSPLNMSLLCA